MHIQLGKHILYKLQSDPISEPILILNTSSLLQKENDCSMYIYSLVPTPCLDTLFFHYPIKTFHHDV